MDTRLAILSAAAFAGVVVGGALIADPGLASGFGGGSERDNAPPIDQGVGQPTDAVFTTATSTTGTRGHDEHDDGRSKGGARSSSGSASREHEHDNDEDDD